MGEDVSKQFDLPQLEKLFGAEDEIYIDSFQV